MADDSDSRSNKRAREEDEEDGKSKLLAEVAVY